ncbi:uncharacterized protein LOC142992027 [Genypterus blacodes]|uniref:uncharacterized protein LOC142992027 n=1 Tax=Genypterus blacodes TaxID=154954 RepID=UPI003F76298A
MAERQRTLPSWMEKKAEGKKEKKSVTSSRKRRAERSAFYCMNERELVQAAVSFLTNGAYQDAALLTDQKAEHKAVETDFNIEDEPDKSHTEPEILEESSFDADAQDLTYVSETDLDITEVETLPYTSEPDQQAEGQRSGPCQDHSRMLNPVLEAEQSKEPSQMPAEEDDAFRLVREIFFS